MADGTRMTMDEVRAMFPREEVENYPCGHGVSAIAASWEDPNPKKPSEPLKHRQSMLIPNKPNGLEIAAKLLRVAVDAMRS